MISDADHCAVGPGLQNQKICLAAYWDNIPDGRHLTLTLEKFLCETMPSVVGVVRRSPQNVFAVHRSITIDVMPSPDIQGVAESDRQIQRGDSRQHQWRNGEHLDLPATRVLGPEVGFTKDWYWTAVRLWTPQKAGVYVTPLGSMGTTNHHRT
ncbi:hypothetical protein TNCV_1554311 [Trichonephila clavipes]|nr:hypothetical protein TNCV_1554311 [Trichonephila clavipes]